jgi:hypothetical protein
LSATVGVAAYTNISGAAAEGKERVIIAGAGARAKAKSEREKS